MLASYSFSGDLCKVRNALDQACINFRPISVECAILFVLGIFKHLPSILGENIEILSLGHK